MKYRLKHRYEINDTRTGHRAGRFSARERAERELAFAGGAAGRFVLVDRVTNETLATSR